MYYALGFDEMAIRQQLSYDGEKITGRIDYGGMAKEPKHVLAKSALFCLATEINGHKAFPIAYILTAGIKAAVLAEFMQKCISAVNSANGEVVSISFDGLPANFSAATNLGACFSIQDGIKPSIEYADVNQPEKVRITNIVPDACHMMKLVRNNWEKCETLYNGDGQVCQ